jgi:hypothetical protein
MNTYTTSDDPLAVHDDESVLAEGTDIYIDTAMSTAGATQRGTTYQGKHGWSG